MPGPSPRVSPQTAKSQWDDEEDGAQEPEFKPLTREQVQQWRTSQPETSIWQLVGWQVLAGCLASGLAWWLSGRAPVAWSVLYGATSVSVPTAVMAWGLTSSSLTRRLSGEKGASLAGFLLWEGVKVLLAVALMGAAPKLVPQLNWLAMLVGVVVVLKVYWFGVWYQSSRRAANG